MAIIYPGPWNSKKRKIHMRIKQQIQEKISFGTFRIMGSGVGIVGPITSTTTSFSSSNKHGCEFITIVFITSLLLI
jgi:MFS-type transporter involved in bile tolerance (Atg22 family)